MPPCYQRCNFDTLKALIHKIEVVNGEAIDYLLSPAGKRINKASLSNIFEYTSSREFELVCHALAKDEHRQLDIVFWNLLNAQGEVSVVPDNVDVRTIKATAEDCFYFKNVLQLRYQPALSTKLTLLP